MLPVENVIGALEPKVVDEVALKVVAVVGVKFIGAVVPNAVVEVKVIGTVVPKAVVAAVLKELVVDRLKVVGAAAKASLLLNGSLSFSQSKPPEVLLPSSNIASTSALDALAFAVALVTLFSGNDCSFYDSILSSSDLTLFIISPNWLLVRDAVTIIGIILGRIFVPISSGPNDAVAFS